MFLSLVRITFASREATAFPVRMMSFSSLLLLLLLLLLPLPLLLLLISVVVVAAVGFGASLPEKGEEEVDERCADELGEDEAAAVRLEPYTVEAITDADMIQRTRNRRRREVKM